MLYRLINPLPLAAHTQPCSLTFPSASGDMLCLPPGTARTLTKWDLHAKSHSGTPSLSSKQNTSRKSSFRLLSISQLRKPSFRTLTSSAPLKGTRSRIIATDCIAFRTLTSSAPLKAVNCCRTVRQTAPLPNSHEFGPVEGGYTLPYKLQLSLPSELSRVRPR